MYPSETSKHRDKVSKYCVGNGLDLGSASDPITPTAIQIELHKPYCPQLDSKYPPQLRGDATNLYWFRGECLDYVFSSHLIEDFTPTEQKGVIAEWCRVVKKGGYLVILAPEKHRWKEALAKGQPPNNSHKNELEVGELAKYLPHNWEVIEDRLCDDEDYGLLFVARKTN